VDGGGIGRLPPPAADRLRPGRVPLLPPRGRSPTGWSVSASAARCLSRCTISPFARGKGFVLHLTQPLAAGALSPRDFHVRRWHYRYSKDYGSPKFDEQEVAVEKVEAAPDRRSLILTLPVQTHPGGMVYYLQADNRRSSDGEALAHREAWYTGQRIDVE
jgi:hypothetical protein